MRYLFTLLLLLISLSSEALTPQEIEEKYGVTHDQAEVICQRAQAFMPNGLPQNQVDMVVRAVH